jgi:hypothetical protein
MPAPPMLLTPLTPRAPPTLLTPLTTPAPLALPALLTLPALPPRGSRRRRRR